jgi:ABC-2 type transport system ATP-binding protein
VSETAISVRDVTKTFRLYRRRETTLKAAVLRGRRGEYEQLYALRDVSFEVPAGQALGIIGRNGSGKSTTLKLLARILRPNRGTIAVTGRTAALLELGAGFHPEYSAIENIFLAGAIHGLERRQIAAKVDEIIAFAELERFADNPVKTYSSGMYARLGFAIAMCVEPDVLLIDEVLAVGDARFRARSFERMLAFRKAGKTLVLVTHDLNEVISFCDRALWIEAGEIAADGAPNVVVERYLEASAAGPAPSTGVAAASGALRQHVPINPDVPIVLRSLELETGDGIAVRVGYHAEHPVRSPICELDFVRPDGVLAARTSTALEGFDPGDVLEGEGVFGWKLSDATLAPGSYYVTVRLQDESGRHVLDQHESWGRFEIGEAGIDSIVAVRGSWTHEREPVHARTP